MSFSLKSNFRQVNKNINYDIKRLEKRAKKNIVKKYGSIRHSSLQYQYIGLIMENLIFNKNSHLVTIFKDYMIWDYYDEFLKRFYALKESTQRVPKFSVFYKNYLKFFCIPTLRDQNPNDIIHACSEKKAENFYKENYQRKKKDDSELKDCGIYQDSNLSEEGDSKININNISKMIFFNETARKKIERISPINTSMVLNESETKLKEDESGLLVTASELDFNNENSLRDIMMQLKKKKKINSKNQKLTLYANDYITSEIMYKNKEKNSRNKSLDILSNRDNKNKQMTAYNLSKNKENKDMIDILYKNIKKDEKKSSNYLMNINSINVNNNKKNSSKLITSFNNIYNNSRNQSQNPHIINSNTYSRNRDFDKINNVKKTINLNLLKTKNIQNILGKINPSIYINSNNSRNSKIFNKNNHNKESITNSAKSIFIKNENNLKMTNYKYFIKNSSHSQSKLPKASSIKTNRKTGRILSYKDYHKSESESVNKNNNKNTINAKLSFDGIIHKNANKKFNIINYNGDKHIHNINININNHYNIGSKQFHEIFTFSDLLKKQNKNAVNINKKNNIHTFLKKNNKNNNIISRNKNQNYEVNSLINNTKNNKLNSTNNIHNSINKNNTYRSQYIINNGKSDIIYNLKQKKANKIKLNSDKIFSY
jgi:hypothetical protein